MTASPITKDDLAKLMQARDAARGAYSSAVAASRAAAEGGLSFDQRLALDMNEKAALMAAVATDQAYHDAMDALMAQEAA